MTTQMKEMITDEQELVKVTNQWGREQKIYDDGFGSLWAYRESLGIVGIVRAQTYEAAWDCVLDEILTPVPIADITESPDDYYVCERDYHCGAPKKYDEGRCLCSLAQYSEFRICWKCNVDSRRVFPNHNPRVCKCQDPVDLEHEVSLTLAEGYEYMPNFGDTSGIVATDLNGNALDRLTPKLVAELELTVTVQECE